MRALLLAAALLPLPALANGGPVAWSAPSGRGGLAPTTVGEVRLVSERLRVAFDASGDGFTVAADYLLRNDTGRPMKVKYGVPIDWVPEHRPDEYLGKAAEARAAKDKAAVRYPGSVEIHLAGVRHPCALQDVRWSDREEDQALWYEGWCVAELEIPATGAVALSLRYPGSFKFVDWS